MEPYIFSLGLIPVRDWIAQARRSRDLRAGSVLLWFTMARILAELEKKLEADIWLPRSPEGTSFQKLAKEHFSRALDPTQHPYGIPNRASGACEADRDKVHEVFQDLQEKVVLDAWSQLRADGLGALKDRNPLLWEQIKPHWLAYRDESPNDCPLSLVWVACPAPFPLDEQHKPQNLNAIDRLYSDVKRTRPFQPTRPGHPIGKCTQCGQREAIGPTKNFPDWRNWYHNLVGDPSIQKGRRFDAGERLCYVCLVKRMASYQFEDRFPSTGEIAAAKWLEEQGKNKEVARLLANLRKTETGKDDFGRLLYASERDLKALEDEGIPEIVGRIRDNSSIPRIPPRYLALLSFDGDDMGRRVHQDPGHASEKMNTFAQKARMILKEALAEAFYLGGDEGLAMAPAENALPLAFALHGAFDDTFRDLKNSPTLSLGIAFFEHSRPLRGAILAAGHALESAKALDGKNALGVRVETASGNRWGFTAHWGSDWDRIQNAVGLIQGGELSSGWPHDVEKFLETIPKESWTSDVIAAARAEVERLFLRRFQPQGKMTAEEKRAAKKKAWSELAGPLWWKENERKEIPAANPQQLHLIGFLARQGMKSLEAAEP